MHLALPGASICVLRPADNVQHMISKKKPYDYVGDNRVYLYGRMAHEGTRFNVDPLSVSAGLLSW